MVRAQHQKQQTDENLSPALLGLHGQRIMMPGADSEPARVAGGNNKHKHQSCNNNNNSDSSSGNGDLNNKVEPLIVFDWDDTMLTSSWIQVNDLLQAGSYDELPLEVRRDLAQLERSVVKCLKNARRLGTVIIITNAESGWVELSAARFFVNVLPLLEGVPVISARSLFESQFPGSPLCWKSAAFAYMMHDHFLERPQWMQKKVVSIGDSNEEKVAMRIASGQHGTMAAKSVKFITGPDPEALACQLDFVTKHLASVLSSNSDVDIVLDASMIHGSYSLPLHSRGVYDDLHQQQPQQQHQQLPLAASPRPSCSSPSSSSSTSSSSSYGAPAAATNPCCTASASTATRAQSPSAATAFSTPSSSSSPSTVSSSSTTFGSTRGACGGGVVAVAGRGRSSSMGNGCDRVERPTARSSSSSFRRDPSSSRQQYLALKRRASSSPIPIPPAANANANAGGHHGRGRGGSATGGGGTPRSVEGGGDCVQPFPPSQPEDVGGPLSSAPSSSSSCAWATMTPPSANGSSSGEGEAIMAPAGARFYRGRARNGGGGGRGAEGRSAYGGGFPCQVDGGSRPRGRGGDGGGGVVGRRIKGVKSGEGSAVAGAGTKAAVAVAVASEKGKAAGDSGCVFGVVEAVGGCLAPDAGAE
ncbi:conserved unknown protein [Ectocarpus siliculosus]|uniref:Uncharacterized protein n=1 Tax=Ectocarpus siliculosus TaxID=2880 RepID=D7FZF4_ECTSI|nr:conserved unknown protein [Ectocarpus siliculosus]|eukprot:CBJ32771.1 conserved unknown protein [Ectocarpus siliculosus]